MKRKTATKELELEKATVESNRPETDSSGACPNTKSTRAPDDDADTVTRAISPRFGVRFSPCNAPPILISRQLSNPCQSTVSSPTRPAEGGQQAVGTGIILRCRQSRGEEASEKNPRRGGDYQSNMKPMDLSIQLLLTKHYLMFRVALQTTHQMWEQSSAEKPGIMDASCCSSVVRSGERMTTRWRTTAMKSSSLM